VRSSGRVFQSLGAATANDRSPTDTSLDEGTKRSSEAAVVCVCVCVIFQEVERLSETVRLQTSTVDETKKLLDASGDSVRLTDQQLVHCVETVERLKQRISAAEAKLDRLAIERHGLLVYAMVMHVVNCVFLLIHPFIHSSAFLLQLT